MLYSAPVASLKEMEHCDVIYNLKPKTEKSHWYEARVTGVRCESFEIPPNSVKEDVGRGLKDRSKSTKLFCQKIVEELHQEQRILLICRDGQSTCGFIALVCKAWYEDPRNVTAADLVKEARDAGDFTTAKAKEQRIQMDKILEYAREIYNCPFLKKRPKK